MRPRPTMAASETSPSLPARAEADLGYIRRAMERSGRFTAVSGPGSVAMGAVGLLAGLLAARTEGPGEWLVVWLLAAPAAVVLGLAGIARKARRRREGLLSGPARRFLLGFVPPVIAGAALTIALWGGGAGEWVPGTWLLLYGAGVVSGGTFSIALVPVTGVGFLLLGGAALAWPEAGRDVLLPAGFGGLHLAAGILIWRRHGG